MSAKVESPARLHFGFSNLSLARDRLYGGIGVGIEEPRCVVSAERSDDVEVVVESDELTQETATRYVERVVSTLGVGGARVTVEDCIPRHVGLGSGTQVALCVLDAVGRAYGMETNPREEAPRIGRGGRSGVGVAVFEEGGFVFDAGHPAEKFTSSSPEEGDWEVPSVVSRHGVPEGWRFVVVVPDAPEGAHGDVEERKIREVISRADPSIADEVSKTLTDKVLPGVSAGDITSFGEGVEKVGRLNGTWYTDIQGSIYRECALPYVEALKDRPGVVGAGQSSWGPAVYGITTEEDAEEVVGSLREVESSGAGIESVRIVGGDNTGAVRR
ncbi:MAG: beta-ribofuranosylaminobenzene 5'-phosphate synthase family protein [Halobacteria archaeon]|nr:beta-ribofuranosylaminobenzene 5'-phosphate synthase family protein [Halobacteria archaeon]